MPLGLAPGYEFATRLVTQHHFSVTSKISKIGGHSLLQFGKRLLAQNCGGFTCCRVLKVSDFIYYTQGFLYPEQLRSILDDLYDIFCGKCGRLSFSGTFVLRYIDFAELDYF